MKDEAHSKGTTDKPAHLTSACGIASVFNVSRNTVTRWCSEGAPICLVGGKHQANYLELWNWLKQQKPA